MTPRATAVKHGRRVSGDAPCGIARPRLDGGEHGVKLDGVGLRELLQTACGVARFNGCYADMIRTVETRHYRVPARFDATREAA